MTGGKQATRSQQLLFKTLIPRVLDDRIIIHHVTVDAPYRLQIEFERQNCNGNISFERLVL